MRGLCCCGFDAAPEHGLEVGHEHRVLDLPLPFLASGTCTKRGLGTGSRMIGRTSTFYMTCRSGVMRLMAQGSPTFLHNQSKINWPFARSQNI